MSKGTIHITTVDTEGEDLRATVDNIALLVQKNLRQTWRRHALPGFCVWVRVEQKGNFNIVRGQDTQLLQLQLHTVNNFSRAQHAWTVIVCTRRQPNTYQGDFAVWYIIIAYADDVVC